MTISPPAPRNRRADLIAALAFNLVPVLGVLIWDWSVFALVYLYWIENLIVGARTLISMFVSAASHGALTFAGTLFIGAFFTVHYGLFCVVHGVFVVTMFGASDPALAHLAETTPFDSLSIATQVFVAAPNLLIGFGTILAWQIVQFALFIVRGEAPRTNPMALMGAPYPRIVALHITILIGGAIVMALNAPVWGVLVLALMKTAFDAGFILIGKKTDEGPARLEGAGPFARFTRDRPSEEA